MSRKDENTEKIWSLIKDAKVAMLTSEAEGHLHSRPMIASQGDFDGTLWFLTRASSAKVAEVRQDARVNVAYADADANSFVSLSGQASIVKDRASIDRHWSASAQAWFPDGKDDPDVALLEIRVDHAQYWDAPSSRMVVAFDYLKARATGKPPDVGDNAKVDLR